MLCPKWLFTRTHPIAIRDVLAYLIGALEQPASEGEVIEIGGADVLTVASGATATVSLGADWTATSASSNAGNPTPLMLGAAAYLLIFLPVVLGARWLETRWRWQR